MTEYLSENLMHSQWTQNFQGKKRKMNHGFMRNSCKDTILLSIRLFSRENSAINIHSEGWLVEVLCKKEKEEKGSRTLEWCTKGWRVTRHDSIFFSLPFSFLRTFSWYEEWNGERERERPSAKTENQMFPSLAWNQSIGGELHLQKTKSFFSVFHVIGKSKNASMEHEKEYTGYLHFTRNIMIYFHPTSPLNHVSARGSIRLQYGLHLQSSSMGPT